MNFISGMVSSYIDNNLLESSHAIVESDLDVEQWMLNAMIVGIAGL